MLLNDFGHAVTVGEEVGVGGCLHNASDAVIQARIDCSSYTADTQDDWIMLVRMCWRWMRHPKAPPGRIEGMVEFFGGMAPCWKTIQNRILDGCEASVIKEWFHNNW